MVERGAPAHEVGELGEQSAAQTRSGSIRGGTRNHIATKTGCVGTAKTPPNSNRTLLASA